MTPRLLMGKMRLVDNATPRRRSNIEVRYFCVILAVKGLTPSGIKSNRYQSHHEIPQGADPIASGSVNR